MMQVKQLVLKTLTSVDAPAVMRLEEIAQAIGADIEKTRAALIDLQEEEQVHLRNGWYKPSAVALGRQTG